MGNKSNNINNQQFLDLINNIKHKGCRVSQEKLYNTSKKILKSYLDNKYPYMGDKDDVISEVLSKIFNKIGMYDPKHSKYTTWLFRICKNYVIDLWRMENKKSIFNEQCYDFNDNEWCLGLQTHTIDETETISNIDRNNGVFFKNITPRENVLLKFRYIHEYSYNEMSAIFNMKNTTLRSKIYRTLKKVNNQQVVEQN